MRLSVALNLSQLQQLINLSNYGYLCVRTTTRTGTKSSGHKETDLKTDWSKDHPKNPPRRTRRQSNNIVPNEVNTSAVKNCVDHRVRQKDLYFIIRISNTQKNNTSIRSWSRPRKLKKININHLAFVLTLQATDHGKKRDPYQRNNCVLVSFFVT